MLTSKKHFILSILCISIIFGGVMVRAEDVEFTEELGLVECISFALEHHPDMASAQFALYEAEMELKRLELEDPRTIAKKEYEAAVEALDQRREALTEAGMNLALKVEQKYYQILKMIQTVENKKVSLEWSKKQMAIVQVKYDSGLIPEKEVLAMEERLNKAEKEYQRALFDLETGRMELNLTLGRELDQFFVLKDQEFPYEPLEVDLESATEYALQFSKGIKAAQIALEKAEENLDLKKQSEVAEIEIQKAEHQLQEARMNLQRAEQQIIIQLRSSYMSFISSEDMIKEAEKALEEAKKDLEVLTIKYEAGMIPLSDLLNGEQAVTEAEVRCIQVIYDYNLAKASFNQSIGKGYSLYQTIRARTQ